MPVSCQSRAARHPSCRTADQANDSPSLARQSGHAQMHHIGLSERGVKHLSSSAVPPPGSFCVRNRLSFKSCRSTSRFVSFHEMFWQPRSHFFGATVLTAEVANSTIGAIYRYVDFYPNFIIQWEQGPCHWHSTPTWEVRELKIVGSPAQHPLMRRGQSAPIFCSLWSPQNLFLHKWTAAS